MSYIAIVAKQCIYRSNSTEQYVIRNTIKNIFVAPRYIEVYRSETCSLGYPNPRPASQISGQGALCHE